jgi:hypothetical protein
MMDGDEIGASDVRSGEPLLPLVAVFPVLYIAWFLSWFGTVAPTCTSASTDSLRAGLMFSAPFFAVGIFCLHRYKVGHVGLILALPLGYLLAQQALWAVELFDLVNMDGRSACTLMKGYDYGEVHDGWVERSYAPYYFITSVGSLAATATSYWRYLRTLPAVTIAETFD